MFGSQQRNQGNSGVNINTTFRTMFSDLSALRIGAWNDQISLKITPALPSDGSGMRQYDQNRRANTSITLDKAVILLQGIESKIKPAMKEYLEKGTLDNPVSVSVQMGGRDRKSILSIEFKKDEMDDASVYLTLYQNVADDWSAPDDSVYTYKFGRNSYITDYNNKTGTFSGEYVVHSEFEAFCEYLRNQVNLYPYAQHSSRYDAANAQRFSYNANNNSRSFGGFQNNENGFNQGQPSTSLSTYEANQTNLEPSDFGLPYD